MIDRQQLERQLPNSLVLGLAKAVTKGWKGAIFTLLAYALWIFVISPLQTLAILMLISPLLTAQYMLAAILIVFIYLQVVGIWTLTLAVRTAMNPNFRKFLEIHQRWIDSDNAIRRL